MGANSSEVIVKSARAAYANAEELVCRVTKVWHGHCRHYHVLDLSLQNNQAAFSVEN